MSRLENDAEAIYEELGSIKETQKQHGTQLEKITSSLTRVEASQLVQGRLLEVMVAKLDEHDTRFDAVTAKLDEHDARFDTLTAKLDEHDTRFDTLTAKLDEHDARFDAHGSKLNMILDLLRKD